MIICLEFAVNDVIVFNELQYLLEGNIMRTKDLENSTKI